MSSPRPQKIELEHLADKHGVAIVVAEGHRELRSINNNSICRTLNPDGVYADKCRAFCGSVSDGIRDAGGRVAYTCHAGLECRGLASGGTRVTIVGRAFVDPEAYRKATDRALTGDWKDRSPVDLFENVHFASNGAQIDAAAEAVARSIDAAEADTFGSRAKPDDTDGRRTDPSAWRSLFGSILDSTYDEAVASILQFLSTEFALAGVAWIDRGEGSFRTLSALGELSGKTIRLGIADDDPALIQAAANSEPIELNEDKGGRRLTVFPLTVGTDIPAAVATLDDVRETRHEIMNICRRIAPQLEILRLRREVERREKLGKALNQFSSGIKDADSDDLWLRLTQSAAEIMQAERGSILVYDERTDQFEIKALIGARNEFDREADAGKRVATVVLNREKPVVITDVRNTRLPELGEDRRYRSPSFISCPIRIGDRAIGVMSFADPAGGKAFNKDSLELFEAIAPQLAVAVDRARLKEKAGEFEQLSVTDALTGLLNRRYMVQRLAEEVKRSNRHGLAMSFMMLDVDHFKSYNDEFGHPAGDEALKLVGSVIKETLRGADVAARFGGEEFAILLPQTIPGEASMIAERIRHNIEHTEFPHRRVTLSIGISTCSADVCSSETIIAAADKALYEAKRRGRNQVQAFEEMASPISR